MAQGVSDAEGVGAVIGFLVYTMLILIVGVIAGARLASPPPRRVSLVSTLSRVESARLEIPTVRR